MAYRRNTELPHSGLSPQYGKGLPSRNPCVILVPPRDRVKVEWCLVPSEICVELPGLIVVSKPRFVHVIERHCKFAEITRHRPV